MANLVRIKDKFQVTIPVALRRQLAAREGDYLEATLVDNGILLRLKQVVEPLAKPPGLVSFLLEPRSATRSRVEIDKALAADRGSWGQ